MLPLGREERIGPPYGFPSEAAQSITDDYPIKYRPVHSKQTELAENGGAPHPRPEMPMVVGNEERVIDDDDATHLFRVMYCPSHTERAAEIMGHQVQGQSCTNTFDQLVEEVPQILE